MRAFQESLAARLALHEANLYSTIIQVAAQEEVGLYLVGGFVRDFLLDMPNLDLDFVVEGDAASLATRLSAQYGGEVKVHLSFKTARWLLDVGRATEAGLFAGLAHPPESIDFATARTEIYPQPAVLPVVQPAPIQQDLFRRDFTINAMAIQLHPQPFALLLDLYNGQRDLEAGIIRFLHDASFRDDPTRILRAVRFEQRLGFQIEPHTLHHLLKALDGLNLLSGERLRYEIEMILKEKEAWLTWHRLDILGILSKLHPDLHWTEMYETGLQELQTARVSPPFPLALDFDWQAAQLAVLTATLSPEALHTFCRRLSFSRSVATDLASARMGYERMSGWTAATPISEVVYGLEALGEVAWLCLWAIAPLAFWRHFVVECVTHWRHIHSGYDGNRLKSLGIHPGPRLGKILRELRRARLDGEITDDRQEDDYLQTLLHTVIDDGS